MFPFLPTLVALHRAPICRRRPPAFAIPVVITVVVPILVVVIPVPVTVIVAVVPPVVVCGGWTGKALACTNH
jgi:hypothetical protein